MNRRIVAILAITAMSVQPSLADGVATDAHDRPADRGTAEVVEIFAVAQEAVATVDRFTTALAAGDLIKAGAELDPNVLILESGGAERSAAEYLGVHAKADVAFLNSTRRELLRRIARVSDDFAWVATESELHAQSDGKPLTLLSTETMLLQRRSSVWRIVHIHWSSRKKDPSPEH